MKIKKYFDLSLKYSENYKPLYAMFELTNNCNFFCKHCYILRDNIQYLNKKKIFEIIKELKKMGTFKITLTGGEPVLHPSFFEIIKKIESENFFYNIFTNGYDFPDEIFDFIKKSNYFKMFHISLYGLDNETYFKYTGIKNAYDKVIKFINKCIKNNIQIVYKLIINQINYHQHDKLIAFAKEKKSPMALEYTIFPKENHSLKNQEFALTKKQLFEIQKNNYIMFKNQCPDENFFYYPKNQKKYNNQDICVAGKNKVVISYNGNIYPCVTLRKSAGNIYKNKFNSIWKDSIWLNELRNVKNKDIEGCNDCSLLDYCYLKCPGVSYLYYNTIYKAPKIRCELAKINKEVNQNYEKEIS